MSSIVSSLFLGKTGKQYLKDNLTLFNGLAALAIGACLWIMAFRFYAGLGSATNLSQTQPWGIWIGFDMMTGIALAAGGFTIGAAVEIFNLKEFHAIERPAILTGFIGYLLAVVGLISDLGKPWNMILVTVSNGAQSVLYEVAWCVMCYTTVLALEFAVPFFEWLGWERAYRPLRKALLALTVLSVMFSTMHQSALGSLFIIAPGKMHPLWYSQSMFLLFFASAVTAGICMVIVEGTISSKIFTGMVDRGHEDKLILGLGKAGGVVLFALFFLRLQAVVDNHAWGFIGQGFYGIWWLVEVLGFILLPSLLFAYGARNGSVQMVKAAGGLGVFGVVLNRINVSMVAYNYNQAVRYSPSWMEYAVSIGLVFLGIVMFRWIVLRMPIFDGKHA